MRDPGTIGLLLRGGRCATRPLVPAKRLLRWLPYKLQQQPSLPAASAAALPLLSSFLGFAFLSSAVSKRSSMMKNSISAAAGHAASAVASDSGTLGSSNRRCMSSSSSGKKNPFAYTLRELPGTNKKLYDLNALNDDRLHTLPFSIRVLLESAVRNCDGCHIREEDVDAILSWADASQQQREIPFMPARVLLQDFTGVPALVDLAAMRDAMKRLGGSPSAVNPLVDVDLVIDHSVQVDYSRSPEALPLNQSAEMQRNRERFAFLKWGSKAFSRLLIVPPGSGIVHQVNLEYLARVIFQKEIRQQLNNNNSRAAAGSEELLYPDSVVGTDSHTTMINGLGVVGWGVGGIEAEAVMLGQQISMLLPQVVGFELTGSLPSHATATDLVLTVTQLLRKKGVVGKFVEFYGDGVASLSLADRATVANMAPEYGATMGFFPVDTQTLRYLRATGRGEGKVSLVEQYCRANALFADSNSSSRVRFSDCCSLNLSSLEPCVAGPKRPQDRVPLSAVKSDFLTALTAPVGFKGYGLSLATTEQEAGPSATTAGPAPVGSQASAAAPPAAAATGGDSCVRVKRPGVVEMKYRNGKTYELRHGSVVIAAITSCTNTSNPGVILAAGMLAKAAVEKGLSVAPYIVTSLSPGSRAVIDYLEKAGLLAYLEKLGFFTAGFGCMTCIGNTGEFDKEVSAAIGAGDLVAAAVLSGNRNFEGRVHPSTRANFLASPPLVVAYALAGRVDIDFDKEPLGQDAHGRDVFLMDIWPRRDVVAAVEAEVISASIFKKVYGHITEGTDAWNALEVPESSELYTWDPKSTYIHNPPFFQKMQRRPNPIDNIDGAYCLLNLGDSITTDHISPAGNIAANSPAADYLRSHNVDRKDFNTYGSRRGNDEVMVRGTFANIRLVNKMCPKSGPKTVHIPSGEVLPVYNVAMRYQTEECRPMIILAGKEYGSGSSRDWAAKGPYLMGVKAIIAESFERIHRTNLVGMGILPLQFLPEQNADSLGLTGQEQFDICLNGGNLNPGSLMTVSTRCGKEFEVRCRIDTELERQYFLNGGILQFVLRSLRDKEETRTTREPV